MNANQCRTAGVLGLCHQQQFMCAKCVLSVSYLSKGAPMFVEGGAPVPWPNGTMASPSLMQIHCFIRLQNI